MTDMKKFMSRYHALEQGRPAKLMTLEDLQPAVKCIARLTTELNYEKQKLWDSAGRNNRLIAGRGDRDKEWCQLVESVLGWHPVGQTDFLKRGLRHGYLKRNARIAKLEEALRFSVSKFEAITRNDKTKYDHHQPRPDGELPKTEGGTIWLTPKELAEVDLGVATEALKEKP